MPRRLPPLSSLSPPLNFPIDDNAVSAPAPQPGTAPT